MDLTEFQSKAGETDFIEWSDDSGAEIALMGMIGEMGSVAGVIKKHLRDGSAYNNFSNDLIEELGDLLWYVFVTANRLGIVLSDISDPSAKHQNLESLFSLSSDVDEFVNTSDIREALKKGGKSDAPGLVKLIHSMVINASNVSSYFNEDILSVLVCNQAKTTSFFKPSNESPARQFDSEFESYEILPRSFEIDIIEAGEGKSVMQFNQVNIGDIVTNNSYEDDGYRFHDVFHIANAATLGWSPVIRRMLRRKRKSDPKIDEVEDGARAAIVEELVVNLIFNYSEQNGFLRETSNVDIGVLKQIKQLTKGLEVEELAPWEWRHCILSGCKVFRTIREFKTGRIIVDSDRRYIEFRPGAELGL